MPENSGSDRTLDPMFQIVVEMTQEENGSAAWSWDAFGEERPMVGPNWFWARFTKDNT